MMSDRQKQLTTLYELDQTRQPILAAQATVSEQLREAAQIDLLSHQRQELARRLKDERARASDLDWTLEDVEVQLRILSAESQPLAEPAIAHEVAALRQRQAEVEDQILEQLDIIESLEREQAQIEAEWLRRSGAWAELGGSIQAEAQRLTTSLTQIEQERQAVIASLPASDQTALATAALNDAALPLALAKDETCTGCGAALPVALLTALDRDQTAACHRCMRLLITVPDVETDAADAANAAAC